VRAEPTIQMVTRLGSSSPISKPMPELLFNVLTHRESSGELRGVAGVGDR
jgi:hypothetical protein